MRILKLTAENIKRLTAVQITPAGDVIPVSGRNGSGKTSVLDSIWWALAGTEHIQAKPIREGEAKARIQLDLGELVVERRFTPKGSYLDVSTPDGASYKSPQKMLDELVGALSFDPLQFASMGRAEQAETLRQLAGIDLSSLSTRRQSLYQERRDVNRDVKQAKADFDTAKAKAPSESPGDAQSINDLVSELDKASAQNDHIDAAARQAESFGDRVLEIKRGIDAVSRKLEALQKELAEAESAQETADRGLREAQATRIDVEPIRARLMSADESNQLASAWKEFEDASATLSKLEAKASSLSKSIEAVDQEKARLIAEADLPLKGLGIDDELGVTFDELPLTQASHAEQLRVSMAIAMAMNPKLRVLRITDASLLDDDSLELVTSLAHENDYQIWLEVVDTSGKVGVVIEDGTVAADNQTSEAA